MPQTHDSVPDSPLPAGSDRAAAELETERVLSVCRKLRTKLAFTPLVSADGERLLWQKGDGSTSVYWCCATMECAGPDGGLVHANLCREDRGCYIKRD
jgi:hypothetical protein